MSTNPAAADHPVPIPALRAILKSQYRAALAMFQQAVEQCPDTLWTDRGPHGAAYWHLAYHTLFFTHLYLQPDEAAFTRWAHHRDEYQCLGNLPWPPHRPAKIGEPYTKAQVLEYLHYCLALLDAAVDRLDFAAPTCGFPWYKLSKLEHQFVNIRHIQHHTAQLSDRLRAATGAGVDWVGGKGGG